MKAKVWVSCWLVIVVSCLSVIGALVYKVDPLFHYHAPNMDRYYYKLSNERSINDGIIKHFQYDAVITGTSMIENFKTSEMDELFEVNSIKIPFAGASYKEINDNIENALLANPDLKIVIRGLDMSKFFDQADLMRLELGQYPTYLYDDNPWNDVEYIFNRDIVFTRVFQMITDRKREGFVPGIMSFDDYASWMSLYTLGIDSVSPERNFTNRTVEGEHLSEGEKVIIKENIDKNVTSITDRYPEVRFYYFYTPYSAAWWCDLYNSGNLSKQIEAEKYITELILSHDNIYLFSFNTRTDITTDLNNYRDPTHYASWINSLMLKWMHDGSYRLTEDNYEEYFEEEYDFYTSYDYASMNNQIDYKSDFWAAALYNHELTGAVPIDILDNEHIMISEVREDDEEISFSINMDEKYNYLCFSVQKRSDDTALSAYVYDEQGIVVNSLEIDSAYLDEGIRRCVMDLSAVHGRVTVVIGGSIADNNCEQKASYSISDIALY